MNVKISVLVICVQAIVYLLYNLHACTFKCSFTQVKKKNKSIHKKMSVQHEILKLMTNRLKKAFYLFSNCYSLY